MKSDQNESDSMTMCPNGQQLQQWLKGELTSNDQDRLSQHITACFSCSATLDDVTDEQELSSYRDYAANQQSFSRHLDLPFRDGDLGSINELAVESVIGTGGMGVVFKGYDVKLERAVAIKVVLGQEGYTSSSRFEREIKAAAKLRHDHLVGVYSADRTPSGIPFLVMPLIHGESLKSWLNNGSLTHKKSVEWIRQIATGLHAAHETGLVHRDVKPANILLDQDDDRAKLADFGLSKSFADTPLTQANVLAGTPPYMSPQQIVDPSSCDPKSDIYSLGITLYECLTGTTPFKGKPIQVLEQHQHTEPIAPSRIDPSIAKDIENVCLKAIAKSPQRRYQTAKDLADDLQRFLDGKPVNARETTQLEKAWLWVGRNRSLASLMMLLFISLLLGTVVSSAMWMQSRQNERVANQRADRLSRQTDKFRDAIDKFYANVVNDDANGFQLSAEFRNRMIDDMLLYYEFLLLEDSGDQEVVFNICDKVLQTANGLENLQLAVPVSKMIAWDWHKIKPIASREDADSRELTLAAQIALSASQKTYALSAVERDEFEYATDETLDAETMLEHARNFSLRAIEIDDNLDARICQTWALLLEARRVDSSDADKGKTIATMQKLVDLLDVFATEDSQHKDLYFYRAKGRRLIGQRTSPTVAASLRGESIEIFKQQLKMLSDRGDKTIWARRSVSLNRFFQGIAYLGARDAESAFSCLDTAIEEFNEILAEHPTFLISLADLAEAHWLRCESRWRNGDPESAEATADYKRSVELFRRLLAIDPNQPSLRRRLALIQYSVAKHLVAQDNLPEAVVYFENSVDDYRPLFDLPHKYIGKNWHNHFREHMLAVADDLDAIKESERSFRFRSEARLLSAPGALIE